LLERSLGAGRNVRLRRSRQQELAALDFQAVPAFPAGGTTAATK
jgi:hypothetical protein